jgi:integrase
MSLYRREGSPFWQYSFTVNGARFRGSTGCAGKREAQIIEAEKRHAIKRGMVPKDKWTLHICLGSYWSERAKNNRSSKTILAKLDALRRILGKDTQIMALTNAMLMDYRATRRGEGLQAHSVNRDLACLKAALNHANQMHGQQVPALAWSRIKVAEPPHRRRFLSLAEFASLIAVCDDGLELLVRAAVETGLRKGNLLALDWREVDLSSGLITVSVKGNKLHTVRMTRELKAALARKTERKGLVFETKNFRRRWAKAVKAAELDDFRFHDLRHTCGSWARQNGADLADICEALGHSSVAVTMRYAHIEADRHKTVPDRIAKRVWSHSASQSRKARAK